MTASPSTRLVRLQVNGEPVERACEPRTHLGDFLRKDLGLTGTHLSCEHGVCGACTVLVDGVPQRACITFAASCEDSEVVTIEGWGDDPVMAALRRAFHEHHALQCGYCTPGMLCTARDIVLRLPGPDAQRVRHELAGNLCRCTGYVGIVEAIDSVLAAKARGELEMPAPREAAPIPAMPVRARAVAGASAAATAGSTAGAVAGASRAAGTIAPAGAPRAAAGAAAVPSPAADPAGLADWTPIEIAEGGDWAEVEQALALPVTAAEVWSRLQDLPLVARCLPGATISRHAGDRAEGTIDVAFGPIGAAFAMRAELFRDEAARVGRMHAQGTDRLSGTRVKSRLRYEVHADGERASRLALRLAFRLEGPLAQFSRSGLVIDYVSELSRRFAANLQAVAAGPGMAGAAAPMPHAAAPSVFRLLVQRLRRLFGFA
jgi:carbon-monoxide dehydrogenase small subunit